MLVDVSISDGKVQLRFGKRSAKDRLPATEEAAATSACAAAGGEVGGGSSSWKWARDGSTGKLYYYKTGSSDVDARHIKVVQWQPPQPLALANPAAAANASTKRGVAGVEDEAPRAAQAAGSVPATGAGMARARLAEFEKTFYVPPAPPTERAPNLGVYAALEGVRYVPETILGECHSSHGEEFFIAMQASSSFDSVAVLLDEEIEIAETDMSRCILCTTLRRACHSVFCALHMNLPPCPPLFLSAPKVARGARQMERSV